MSTDSIKNILLSHPTGNANVRGALEAFRKHGLLESFHTCVACFQDSLLYHLSKGPLKDFKRREFDKELQARTFVYPWRELGRMASAKLGLNSLTRHEKGYFCIDAVCQSLDADVARYIEKRNIQIDAIYAYEDCALSSFQAAHKYGKACFYELPIGYWRAMHNLLKEECEKNPDWAVTLGGLQDSKAKLERKERELAWADRIFVASTFTKQTLDLYPGKLSDIIVLPYGFPPVNLQREYVPVKGRKIKILFVGGLSQRKGISYLFEAVRSLEKAVDLTIVGNGAINQCPALKKALEKVHYIPSLPHDEILDLMATQDLLIFPSLFEGFGLVITEAMSQGTPVITTERTCGPDIITNGQNGWIVPAGTAEPIKEIVEQLITHPDRLQRVGQAARKTALAYSWACYGDNLARAAVGN